MYKVLVVNVFVGSVCMVIVTGCSFKTNKATLVNKEMARAKEVISSNKILSAEKNLIFDSNINLILINSKT